MKTYATLLAALADENRLRLLHLLRDGEMCVCHLQGTLEANQPKISRHLAYLRRAGLVEARRQGKWMHYSLKKQPAKVQRLLKEVLNAIENEAKIKRDVQRAKRIRCAPSRFGYEIAQKRSNSGPKRL